jgi:hypothetical protein
MSVGKSTSTTTPTLSQEQKDQIAAQTGFFTGTIAPTYKNIVGGATDLYNKNAPGMLEASQNLGGVAGQAQNTLGETGESALRTGISGLENLFSKDYESNQIAAAMGPAQAQYLQNLEMQQRQFGGAGMLGSARDALASRQLAGTNQMNQAQIAAQIQSQIAQQRAGVGSTLAQLGQGGIGQALGAAGTKVTASAQPLQQYGSLFAPIAFGTPTASYNPNFAGTQGQSTTGNKFGISI